MKNHERALAWAGRHFDVLKADIERFEQEQEGPLVIEPDEVAGQYLVKRPGVIPPLDPDWVFRVGDLVHGIRAALDYLAFAVVNPTLPKDIENTAFPICRGTPDKNNWASLHLAKLPNVPLDVLKAFYDLQPCAAAPSDVVHQLTVLDTLENIHKHRHPLIILPQAPMRGYAMTGPMNFDIIEVFWLPDPGAPVYRLRMHSPDDRPNANFQASIQVCFDQTRLMSGKPVVYTLEVLQDFVRKNVFGSLGARAKF